MRYNKMLNKHNDRGGRFVNNHLSKMYEVVGSLQDLLLVALVQRVKGQMLYKRP